jgi:hypothetical protein
MSFPKTKLNLKKSQNAVDSVVNFMKHDHPLQKD